MAIGTDGMGNCTRQTETVGHPLGVNLNGKGKTWRSDQAKFAQWKEGVGVHLKEM
jgi:hypothetical protein